MNLSPKLAFLVIITGLILPSFSLAAEFDPNYLISDEEMQNWQCMNTGDIQAFLDDNGGYIARLKTEDKNGERKTTADIIYQAAREYKINPKYLLVKLQKEQSLITETSPTQKQLDGATGYGITDGCGWSCDTYLNNKGFGKQVDSAAGIMRWYYENTGQQSWIKQANQNYAIDNTIVKPVTLATAFLYTYTPHLQGNKNFWTLWQRWFDQIYPDGSLVKTTDSTDIYVVSGGKKRLITSMSALVTRYNPKLIITIPSSELARYETGTPVSLPNYSILKLENNYYLLDYDTLRPFASADVVRQLGYNPDEIITVTAPEIAGYPIGQTITTAENPLGRLVRVKETAQLYYVNNNTYYPMLDDLIAKINYPNLTQESVPISFLKDLTMGDPLALKDGTLFGVAGFNQIYVMEKGEKRHIASEDVFEGMGYKWENIVWLNQFAGIKQNNGQAIYLREGSKTAVAVNTAEKITDNATELTETGQMITTPAEKTEFIGPVFDTAVNTYLVADYDTQEILAGKNIDSVRPMASFTKLMTAYRLMQDGINMSRTVIYDPSKHESIYNHFRVTAGESVRVSNLFDAFLVSSLNTPAYMLVDGAEINLNDFVAEMNTQAVNWGLAKTKFADPAGTGLGNITTAREYLTIFSTVAKNSTIKAYLGKKNYAYDEVIDKDGQPHHFDNNSNELANQTNLRFNIISTKTGYLEESGSNLAMVIERPSDKKKFIVITMGNPDYAHRFDEPKALVNWVVGKF